LLLERQVGGHKISDNVVFIAATNRKSDRAGVSGILEPVKSRFWAIIDLDPVLEDWVDWAYKENVPGMIIAFLRYRPDMLCDFKPTADMKNSPSPRTWNSVSEMLKAGLDKRISSFSDGGTSLAGFEYDMISGAIGNGAAMEFIAFANIANELLSYEEILRRPKGVKMPTEPSVLWATIGMLESRMLMKDYPKIHKFLTRMDEEFQVAAIRSMAKKHKKITKSKEFVSWAAGMGNYVMEG
jgi:hypothetical protein